jgi:hypothetical protein
MSCHSLCQWHWYHDVRVSSEYSVKQLFCSDVWRRTLILQSQTIFHDFMYFLFGPAQICVRIMLNFHVSNFSLMYTSFFKRWQWTVTWFYAYSILLRKFEGTWTVFPLCNSWLGICRCWDTFVLTIVFR